MKWPHTDVGQKENHMPLPNSKETTFPHSEEQSLRQQVTSFEEWRALAGAWPLKRLVALWNDLPGVPPVQKFTNREIALERIWRFLHPPEQTTPRKAAEQKNPFRPFPKHTKATSSGASSNAIKSCSQRTPTGRSTESSPDAVVAPCCLDFCCADAA